MGPVLALGTAQFGMAYGATNTVGQVDEGEVARILELAAASGVTMIDTATLYRSAEAVLGRALPASHAFRIVTKSPAFGGGPIMPQHVAETRAALEQSLERLNIDSVYALLVHHAEDLLCPGGDLLMAGLDLWRAEGLTEKIGVSVYSGREAIEIAGRYDIDVVQLPLNILDQRSLMDGTMDHLSDAGIELHVRSIFLQGVAVEPARRLPDYFSRFSGDLDRLATAAEGFGRVAFALGFIRQVRSADAAIVGVSSRRELQEVLDAWMFAANISADFSALRAEDEELISPMRWTL